MDAELARRVALDCSKRCAYSYKGPIDDLGMPVGDGTMPETIAPGSKLETPKGLNASEQVCMSRCINKWIQGKQTIDQKLKGQVQGPLLF